MPCDHQIYMYLEDLLVMNDLVDKVYFLLSMLLLSILNHRRARVSNLHVLSLGLNTF